MSMANRKHDVVAVHVCDASERTLPDIGLVTLRDPETGRYRLVDTGARGFAEAFQREADGRVDRLRRSLGTAGIDLISIDASGSVVDPLVRFFRLRERRRR